MRWGESQSSEKPEVAQGVSSLSLFVFLGAATDLIRRRASPTSATPFCPPATTTVFFGPKVIALIRFPFWSRFTRHPSRVTAFVPVRNRSQVSWPSRVSAFFSGGTRPWSRSVFPFPSRASKIPISWIESDPPNPIEDAFSHSASTRSRTDSRVRWYSAWKPFFWSASTHFLARTSSCHITLSTRLILAPLPGFSPLASRGGGNRFANVFPHLGNRPAVILRA